MNNREIVEVFKFTSQEIKRLESLGQTNPKQAAAEIGLHSGIGITHEEFPKIHYECGKAAAKRLYEMAAKKLLDFADLRGRVEVGTFLKPMTAEFAKRALINGNTINEKLIEMILQEAITRAKGHLENRIYFFPVYALQMQDSEDFVLDGIRFFLVRRFWQEIEPQIERSVDIAVEDEAKKSSDSKHVRKHLLNLFSLAKQHYGNYRWIACVEIRGAEKSIGWKKAREVLEQTLNLLRLPILSREGQFIGIADESSVPRSNSRVSLNLTANNQYEASHSISYVEPHVEKEFLHKFRQKVPQISFLERAIEKVRQWETPDEIEDRLLTALFWFGEAWKENRPLPKIVKFSTSLESLFATQDSNDSIAEKISERLAWLSYFGDADWEKRSQTFTDMKAVYGARSKAVHGASVSKSRDLLLRGRQAEELARLGVFAFSQLPPLFDGRQNKEQKLQEFFTRLKLEGFEQAQKLLSQA
jgi:hypothetical protein